MSVQGLLSALLLVIVLLFMAAAWWAYTRPADRLQLATTCLFFIACLNALSALRLMPTANELTGLVWGQAVYALLLYGVMTVLALYPRRWAWMLAIGACAIHVVLMAHGLWDAMDQASGLQVIVVCAWLSVGLVGLWACLHSGTRDLIRAGRLPAT